jgi:hypothetical protein
MPILLKITNLFVSLQLGGFMRTTLDIEDDVLLAAKEMARRQRLSIGKVLSNLARRALTQHRTGGTREGVPLFPVQKNAGVATLELVNRLRDDQP